MSKVVKTAADPSGYFDGTATIGSMFDPGGEAIKKITGSDIGRRIADPMGLFKQPEMPSAEPTRQTISQAKESEGRRLSDVTKSIDRTKQLMKRGGAGRSLLIRTSPIGIPSSGGPAMATSLGG